MKYFPDQPADSVWARCAVAVLPLVYLVVALIYSANSAPWGRTVDPQIRVHDERHRLDRGLRDDPEQSPRHDHDRAGRTGRQDRRASQRPAGRRRIRTEALRRADLCLASDPDISDVRRAAGRRYHRSPDDAKRVRRGHLPGRAVCPFRGPASRYDAGPREPDGHIGGVRHGAGAQGGARPKAANGRPRRGAGRDLCARPLVQIPLCAAGGPQRGAVAKLARLCRGDRCRRIGVLCHQSDSQPRRFQQRFPLARRSGDAQGHLRPR